MNEELNNLQNMEEKRRELIQKLSPFFDRDNCDEPIQRFMIAKNQTIILKQNLENDFSEPKEKVLEKITNESFKISYSGLELDIDLNDMQIELERKLSQSTLKKILVSEIRYYNNQLLIVFEGQQYAISPDFYHSLLIDYSEFDWNDYRRRAFSETSLVLESGTYYRTPIKVFSFAGEKMDDANIWKNLPYLQNITYEKRLENYKKGTIWHEIGHHIHAYIISNSEELNNQWKEIVDHYGGGITPYAKARNTELQAIDYDEEWAETIRLYMKNKEYLMQSKPEVSKWIDDLKL